MELLREVCIVFLLPIMFIFAVIYVTRDDTTQWDTFQVSHNCKKVGYVKGNTQMGVGYGMAGNGQFGTVVMTSRAPGKTGWFCDDGVTYWR